MYDMSSDLAPRKTYIVSKTAAASVGRTTGRKRAYIIIIITPCTFARVYYIVDDSAERGDNGRLYINKRIYFRVITSRRVYRVYVVRT